MIKEKVLIVIPFYSNIEPATMKSILDLSNLEQFSFTRKSIKSASLVNALNLAFSDVDKYDYVFKVDSDMSFTIDQFLKLIKAVKSYGGFASCIYRNKFTGTIEAGKGVEVDQNGILRTNQILDTEVPLDGDILNVSWFGGGGWVANTSVFKTIPKPFYKTSVFNNIAIPEDISFCLDALHHKYLVGGCEFKHLTRSDEIPGVIDIPFSKKQFYLLEKAILLLPEEEREPLYSIIKLRSAYSIFMDKWKFGDKKKV